MQKTERNWVHFCNQSGRGQCLILSWSLGLWKAKALQHSLGALSQVSFLVVLRAAARSAEGCEEVDTGHGK